MTSHPTKLAFPPAGIVNVEPQTPQAMAVVAREKIMASLPQSLQLTLKNWLAIIITCLRVRIFWLFGKEHSAPYQSHYNGIGC